MPSPTPRITGLRSARRNACSDSNPAIGRLNRQLTHSESNTFAGLWIQHEPEFRVVVKFTEGGEDTIQPYIAGGDLEDLMDVGTAPNTLESLRLAQANAIEAADSVGATFEAGINVFDNVAEIYTLEGTALRSDLEGAGKSLPSAVNIVEVGRLSENAASIYGGLSLNKCTTGFAVENSDGTLGITTAAHCEGDLYRDGKPLTKQDQYWGESGDVKWLTAPDFTVENKIRVPGRHPGNNRHSRARRPADCAVYLQAGQVDRLYLRPHRGHVVPAHKRLPRAVHVERDLRQGAGIHRPKASGPRGQRRPVLPRPDGLGHHGVETGDPGPGR